MLNIINTFKRPSVKNYFQGLLVLCAYSLSVFLDSEGSNNSASKLGFAYALVYSVSISLLLPYTQYKKKGKEKWQSVLCIILAIVFSQFITIGRSFAAADTFFLCFGSLKNATIWLFQSVVYSYFLYIFILYVLNWVCDYKTTELHYTLDLRKIFVILCLTKCVFLILFYPCIFDFDAALGLRTYLNPDDVKCNHHPYFILMIHGACFKLGKLLGNASIGFAFLSFICIIVESAILVYGLKLLQHAGLSKKWVKAFLIIFIVFPLYPLLSVYCTKDGIYAYVFFLYILTLFDFTITLGKSIGNMKILVLHSVAILLMCLSRQQGIYIVGISFLFILICYHKFWLKLIVSTITPLVIVLCFINIYLPSQNVEPSNKKELLGNLFQQCAYCYKTIPDEITREQDKGIKRVINIDKAVEEYNPSVTDNVKCKYKYSEWEEGKPNSPFRFRHVNFNDEYADLKAFFKSWFNLFCLHPIMCMESTCSLINGFFSNEGHPLCYFGGSSWENDIRATLPDYSFYHASLVPHLFTLLFIYINLLPVIGWFTTIPYYNWLIIFCFGFTLFRKDKKGLVLLMPIILSTCVLILCPTVTGRYMYPQVIAMPFIIAYLFTYNKNDKNKKAYE